MKNILYNRIERIRRILIRVMPWLHTQFPMPRDASFNIDLTISEIKTLIFFEHRKSCQMTEIARAAGMPLPTSTHVVDKLVTRDYLRRRPDPEDRRLVIVEMTAKGKKIVRRLIDCHRKSIMHLMKIIPMKEQKRIVRVLENLHDILLDLSKYAGHGKPIIGIILTLCMTASTVLSDTPPAQPVPPARSQTQTPAPAKKITLEECLDFTLEHNPQILTAKEKITAAEGARQAASALFWPTISATGIYTRSSYLTNLSFGEPYMIPVVNTSGKPTGDYAPYPTFAISSDRVGDVYMGKIGLQYPIFTWGRIRAGYRIARSNQTVAELDYQKTVADVSFIVKRDFNTILLSREMTRVLDETRNSLAAHVKTVNDRFQEGLASNFEVLRTRVQLANIEPQLTRAKNQMETAKISFNNDLGADKDSFDADGELGYKPFDLSLETCLAEAGENRLELKQLDMRQSIAEDAITVAASSYRPSIMLTGDYQGNRGQQMPPDQDKWQTGWDAGVVINIPLFDGFASFGRVKEAEANLDQIKTGKTQIARLIDLEVQSSYLSLRSSEETIHAQTENVKVAEESLNIIKKRYQEGLATNLEVLDTQVSLLQTRINYLQALYEYNLNLEALRKAMGR